MKTPGLSVEPATLDQAVAVHRLIPEFDAAYIIDNIARDDLAILKKRPYIIVAKVDGKPAGYMIGYDRSDVSKTMHIWLNGTIPEFRGQGVFRALVDNLTEEARTREHKNITTMSDRERFPQMIEALVALGFKKTEDTGSSVRFQRPL